MKTLSKDQRQYLAMLQAKLAARADAVETAYAALEAKISEAWEATAEPAVIAYNEAIAEFEEFRLDIHNQMTGFIEDRSEKWYRSDEGNTYRGWADAWDQNLDELSTDPPEGPSAPDCPHADDYPVAPDQEEEQP